MNARNRSARNRDVLIAASENKRNTMRLLYLSIGFLAITSLSVFFILTKNESKPSPPILSTTEIPPERLNVKSTTDQNSELVSSLLIDYDVRLKAELETISSNAVLSGNENIFSKEAEELLTRLADMLDTRNRMGEHPELQNLEKILKEAEALIAKFNSTFESYLEAIRLSFSNKNYRQFEENLANAQKLASADPRLLSWEKVAPIAKTLFEKFQTSRRAEAQRNHPIELEALKTIKQLGYSDEKIEKRIRDLSFIVTEKKFNELIRSARRSRDEGKLLDSLEHLNAAERIYSGREEVKALKTEVNKKTREKKGSEWKKLAEINASNDDWPEALRCLDIALELLPSDRDVIEKKVLASNIVKYGNTLLDLKTRPLRMTDNDVATFARTILDKSTSMSTQSPSLATLRSEVLVALGEIQRPRSLAISSDGKTTIEVKGIGFVRPTLEKTIQLNPGTYIVHAACPGHKTNLLEIVIPLTDIPQTKRIVCGDPI